MLSFYTMLILLCWMALAILCILVHENSWIPKPDKRLFYLTYGIIACSALAEWVGLQLVGNENLPKWVLALVKCLDYSLTPMAGGAIVGQMKLHNRWNTLLIGVLVANVAFQALTCFSGGMLVINDLNYYTHGPLYPIYIGVYLLVIALMGIEFLIYGKAYRRQNRASLYSVLILVVVGISIQEMLGGEFRTAYIVQTMGASLMFIHYAEFYQMSADDHIKKQQDQIMQDALSGVLSRHAYSKALMEYDAMERLPEDFAAFTIDINGLKSVNDNLGHDAGDELIIGAARCIEKVVGDGGQCYRTGGDEFVVLTRADRERAEAVLTRLARETGAWSGSAVKTLSLSAGYALASEHEELTVEKLVREADKAMYAAKAEYYRNSGIDRRAAR